MNQEGEEKLLILKGRLVTDDLKRIEKWVVVKLVGTLMNGRPVKTDRRV